MSRLVKALSSSVGKKFVMGTTGLLLCGFLLAHLAGNLLLYVGPDAYNHYAETLHEQEGLLKVAEAGLVVLFAAHIFLAVQISRENRAARGVEYAAKQTKIDGQHVEKLANADTWMLISGVIVLLFLIFHLGDFTFEVRPDIDYETMDAFEKADVLLKTPLTYVVYTIGCLILGLHLSHGFSSAFQSLGLSHPKYDPLIKWGGVAFAIVIGAGFASFPIFMGMLG